MAKNGELLLSCGYIDNPTVLERNGNMMQLREFTLEKGERLIGIAAGLRELELASYSDF